MPPAPPGAAPHANDFAVRLCADGKEGGRGRSRDRLRIARLPADRRYEAAVLFHARATLYELNRCHWRLVCLTLAVSSRGERMRASGLLYCEVRHRVVSSQRQRDRPCCRQNLACDSEPRL